MKTHNLKSSRRKKRKHSSPAEGYVGHSDKIRSLLVLLLSTGVCAKWQGDIAPVRTPSHFTKKSARVVSTTKTQMATHFASLKITLVHGHGPSWIRRWPRAGDERPQSSPMTGDRPFDGEVDGGN